MATHTLAHFEGYSELIETPLEQSDFRSLELIRKLLTDSADKRPHGCPFSFLIEALSDVIISQREARTHWKKILDHKRRMERLLNRVVNIKTAVVDYYDQLGITIEKVATPGMGEGLRAARQPPLPPHPRSAGTNGPNATVPAGRSREPITALTIETKIAGKSVSEGDRLLERVNTPGYHLERLKEEMLRARRYKHALSAIMLDIELQAMDTPPISPNVKDRVFAIIVKMINKAVRTVDILARHTENSFLLILPNTNKREALELAERLRSNIGQRTHRIPELSAGIQVTISVGQCSKDDTSSDFVKRLENLITSGKRSAPNAVHALE